MLEACSLAFPLLSGYKYEADEADQIWRLSTIRKVLTCSDWTTEKLEMKVNVVGDGVGCVVVGGGMSFDNSSCSD